MKLELKDLKGWIDEKLTAEVNETCDEAESIVDEILESKKEIKEIIEELDEHDFPEDIKKRVYKPVLTSKPIFVKGILDAIRGMHARKPLDYENLQAFYHDTLTVLKTVQKVQVNQGRYVVVVFREEMLKLGTSLNHVIDLTKRLEEIITDQDTLTRQLNGLYSMAEEINHKVRELAELKNRKKGHAKLMGELNTEIARLKEDLKDIERSKAFKDYAEGQERLEDIKKHRNELETLILNQINPLTRVFRKYKKLVEDEKCDLGKSSFEALEDYIVSPTRTFLSEDKEYPLLRTILSGAEKSIKGGVLILDKKEKEKTIARIAGVSRELRDIKLRHEELRNKEQAILTKLSASKIVQQRGEVGIKIKANEEKIGQLNDEIKTITEKIDRFEREIPDLKNKIEERLAELEERRVEVEISMP